MIPEIPNIAAWIDPPHLDEKLPQVLASLGLSKYEMPKEIRRNQAYGSAEKLDTDACAVLRCYWPDEFRIYNAARRISDGMYR